MAVSPANPGVPQTKRHDLWTDFLSFLPHELTPHSHRLFFAFLWFFYALHPFGTVYHLEGDNLCQIAYFKILLKPFLAGSLGASAVKPGVVLLLGGTYNLSTWMLGNAILVWFLVVSLAATFTWFVMQWTAKLGGHFAAWAAFGLLFSTDFPLHFMRGTSQLFFLPILLGGLFLIPHRKHVYGIALILVAGLFRVEGFFIGGCLLLFFMVRKGINRKECFGLFVFLSTLIGLFVGVTAWVQGGLHRFAGGSSVGYTLGNTLLESSTEQGFLLFQDLWTKYPVALLLLVPSLWLLWRDTDSRTLAWMFLVPLFLLLYKALFAANLVPRYFAFLVPFSLCTGVAGSFRWLCTVFSGRQRALFRGKALFTLCSGTLGAYFFYTQVMTIDFTKAYQPAIEDGRLAARSPLIPAGQRVLVDDPLLFTWLIDDDTHFTRVLAIQAFAQKNLAEQTEAIASFDYIYLSTGQENRPFSYFNFIPKNREWNDPLRQLIIQTLSTGKPTTFGDVEFHRFHLDEARGIVQILSRSSQR